MRNLKGQINSFRQIVKSTLGDRFTLEFEEVPHIGYEYFRVAIVNERHQRLSNTRETENSLVIKRICKELIDHSPEVQKQLKHKDNQIAFKDDELKELRKRVEELEEYKTYYLMQYQLNHGVEGPIKIEYGVAHRDPAASEVNNG